jgi:hypothetical protein
MPEEQHRDPTYTRTAAAEEAGREQVRQLEPVPRGRRLRISREGGPSTTRKVVHTQAFTGSEALGVVRSFAAVLKLEHGIDEGEPTPFWTSVPFSWTNVDACPEVTPRHRLCALVDALAELRDELDGGGVLELTLTVRR